jgi:transcription elongation factor GreA
VRQEPRYLGICHCRGEIESRGIALPRFFIVCRLECPMLDELRNRLQEQIEALDRELRIDLPRRIASAVAQGDLRENAEYSSALERQEFIRARLTQLTRRQSELSAINLKDVPPDVAGFGSLVELEDDSGERHAWRLVFPEFIDLDETMISIASPMGRALVGKSPGETVALETPEGETRYRVIHIETLHGESLSENSSEDSNG